MDVCGAYKNYCSWNNVECYAKGTSISCKKPSYNSASVCNLVQSCKWFGAKYGCLDEKTTLVI